ncbi:MAG: hypothetical protein IJA78_04680 [Clostridia bacterium]|nr:hypothetical protein [Clostridia bacterium]
MKKRYELLNVSLEGLEPIDILAASQGGGGGGGYQNPGNGDNDDYENDIF